jgi:hypothetical protein
MSEDFNVVFRGFIEKAFDEGMKVISNNIFIAEQLFKVKKKETITGFVIGILFSNTMSMFPLEQLNLISKNKKLKNAFNEEFSSMLNNRLHQIEDKIQEELEKVK